MNRVEKQDAREKQQAVLNDKIKEQIEAFEERAAIMEFDGGLTRREAEKLARNLFYGVKNKISNSYPKNRV